MGHRQLVTLKTGPPSRAVSHLSPGRRDPSSVCQMTPGRTVCWLPRTVSSAFSPVGLCRGSLTTVTAWQPPKGDPLPSRLACRNVQEPGPVTHRRQVEDTVVHASASRPPQQKPGTHKVGWTPSLLYGGMVSSPQSRSPGEALLGTRRGAGKPCSFQLPHLPSGPGSCHTAS